MLSRVADAIYWMNRYMERAENVARFVDVNLHLSLDRLRGASGVEAEGDEWRALIETTGDLGLFAARYGAPRRENVLEFLTFDEEYPSSVLSCFKKARENARTVREIISSEMWEQVNKSYLSIRAAAEEGMAMESPHDFYTEVKHASHLFVGITYLTMTHNEAWHFGRLGRLIERADKTSRIVDVKSYILMSAESNVGADQAQWAALLKSASALEMYRKRHGPIVPANVVDFLLLERKFPRSILYCLTKAERSLHAITGAEAGAAATSAERELGRLHAQFEHASTREILQIGLHAFLDEFQSQLNSTGDAIVETFFAAPADVEPIASVPPPPLAQTQAQTQSLLRPPSTRPRSGEE